MTPAQAKKLYALIDAYWELHQMRESIRNDIAENIDEIKDLLQAKSGKLTEAEAKKFEKEEWDLQDEFSTSISNFTRRRTSVDWDYLERVLTPSQLKRAKKESKEAVFKISSPIFTGRD